MSVKNKCRWYKALSLDKTCIDRKLLAIDATFNDEVLREFFCTDHAYTLFLTVGRRRRDNMVDLTMETHTNKVAAESTLFAVQPPVRLSETRLTCQSITWINGRGKEMKLPL